MDKITVIPENVRGLGNIVSPKINADLVGYGVKLTSSTDSTYGTVFNMGYYTRTVMSLDMPHGINKNQFHLMQSVKLTEKWLSTNLTVSHVGIVSKFAQSVVQ